MLLNCLRALCLGFVALSTSVSAQEAPDAMIKRVMNEVIDIIKTDKDIQAGDTRKSIALVETKILPNFDFNRMTALALGREWRTASAEQKAALTREFQTLLVRSYSNALSQYKNQTVDFKPLKLQPADTEVTVRTEVRQPGAKPIGIDYDLAKAGDSWKVFDVVIGDVSLVTNYRDTFAQEVKAGGVDGLIKSLRDKNQQLAANPPPVKK